MYLRKDTPFLFLLGIDIKKYNMIKYKKIMESKKENKKVFK